MVTALANGALVISDLEEPQASPRITQSYGRDVRSMAFDEDGQYAVISTARARSQHPDRRLNSGATEIRDLATGELCGPLYLANDPAHRIYFDPAGRFVAIADKSGSVTIYWMTAETRSVSVLQDLASLLSGLRLGDNLDAVPLSAVETQRLWEELKHQQPETRPSDFNPNAGIQ
jgi:hypothetical protein